jgi:hypothetical protein
MGAIDEVRALMRLWKTDTYRDKPSVHVRAILELADRLDRLDDMHQTGKHLADEHLTTPDSLPYCTCDGPGWLPREFDSEGNTHEYCEVCGREKVPGKEKNPCKEDLRHPPLHFDSGYYEQPDPDQYEPMQKVDKEEVVERFATRLKKCLDHKISLQEYIAIQAILADLMDDVCGSQPPTRKPTLQVDLLPCPFCGGEAERECDEVHEYYSCSNVDCCAYGIYASLSEWNRRANSSERPKG